MTDTGLHFIVECIMCGDTLVAESDRLTVVVVAAQAHFSADHKKYLTGKEVLEDKSLSWRIDEAIKAKKMPIRPLEGLSFDAILKEVTEQEKGAANLPPLQHLVKH